MMGIARPEFVVPGSQTMSKKVRVTFEEASEKIKNYLKSVEWKVSCTTDVWTAASHESYMVVVAHFVNESFQLDSVILDFVPLPAKHTGEVLASVFETIIDRFGLKSRLLALTTDNAANNTTMVAVLLSHGYLQNPECHIRCMDHVLNLAVRDALKVVSLI
jgi:hypothetical protein